MVVVAADVALLALRLLARALTGLLVGALDQSTDDVQTNCDQLTAKQSSRKTASRAVLVALARSARSLLGG
jgi:hypothetical protein